MDGQVCVIVCVCARVCMCAGSDLAERSGPGLVDLLASTADFSYEYLIGGGGAWCAGAL